MILKPEVVEALRRAGVSGEAADPLAERIVEIGDALENYRTNTDRSPEERKLRLKSRRQFLVRATKALAELETCFRTTDPEHRSLLSGHTARAMGRNLSVAAFEDAGIPINTEVSFRILELRAASEREGPYRACEDEIIGTRQHAAITHGNRAFAFVLRSLRPPLNQMLELGKGRSGNPGDRCRKFAFECLTDDFERATGTTATSTAGGPFALFCIELFPLLGIDTKGIESAIDRWLGERRAIQNPGQRERRLPKITTHA